VKRKEASIDELAKQMLPEHLLEAIDEIRLELPQSPLPEKTKNGRSEKGHLFLYLCTLGSLGRRKSNKHEKGDSNG